MTTSLYRYNDRTRFGERRDEWIEFADRCPLAAPFCHPRVWLAWLSTYIQFDPVVYELRQGPNLIALLPLYREGTCLQLATDGHLDYQDIAAISDDAAIDLLAAVVEQEGNAGYTLAFKQVAEHSRLQIVLASPRLAEVATVRHRYWSMCPFTIFNVKGTDRFFESLSSRQRKDHKAASRRLRESYPHYVTEQHQGTAIDTELLERASRLHRENQYRKKGKSVFTDGYFAAYLERQAALGAPLTLSMLRESPGGDALAFILGYFAGETFHYYITAYEGSNAAFSPGRVLLVETLAHCANLVPDGKLRFDLLSGEESYKNRWATSFYEVSRYQVIPRRITNLPRIAAYSAVYSLKGAKNRLIKWCSGGERLPDLEHEAAVLTS